MSQPTLQSLEPAEVWQIFRGMAAVPRPSKKEEKIREHVRQFAKQHNLAVKEDKVGNIVIQVPATTGHEKAPIIVLQGHLDMVCEKNSGTQHDFDNEGIRLKMGTDPKSGESIVQAEGTTLGADNGIGVSLALAAATAKGVVHGPLEILLTVDEEAGMGGAKGISGELFAGRRMINLDSEEDDSIYIGCAGGCDTNLVWEFPAAPLDKAAELGRVNVEGLRGGHSGGDIHEGRGNAIKLLVRTLLAAGDKLQLVEINGGRIRNAIPREAFAIVSGPAGTIAALQKAVEAMQKAGKAESFEDGIKITAAKATTNAQGALSASDTKRLLTALVAIPSGVLGMHPRVPKLVQTSNNFSTLETKPANGSLKFMVGTLSRSSSQTRLEETTQQIASVGRLSGASVSHGNEYPGWEPNPDSPLLKTAANVYERLFKDKPHILAIHAGLECGIIGERVGGNMDTISFGPRIMGAHSPDERVYPASVEKMWKYLTAVLKELA